MQPSTANGRKLRAKLLPLSWVIAFLWVYSLIIMISWVSGFSLKEIVGRDDLWPLAIVLPGFLFGKVLGFMAMNLFAYAIPGIRRVFQEECEQTGRYNFASAMRALSKLAVLTGLIMVVSSWIFIQCV